MSKMNDAPKEMAAIQEWFGSFIRKPLTKEDLRETETIHPSIQSTERLSSFERMQLYSQSYWLRLRSAVQDDFPLVVRLFSEHDFYHSLAMPYLLDTPPVSWDIHTVSHGFVPWLKKNYHPDDRNLVLDAAYLDQAYLNAFFTKSKNRRKNIHISSKKNILQPHVQLFSFPYHLPQWRDRFLEKDPTYWTQHDFPPLAKEKAPYYFAIFRSPKLKIDWKELTHGAFITLSLLQEGKTIEDACQHLEREDVRIQKEVEENIVFWMQEWALYGFFDL